MIKYSKNQWLISPCLYGVNTNSLSLAFLCEQEDTDTSSGGKKRMTDRVRAFILDTGIVKTRIQEKKQARE